MFPLKNNHAKDVILISGEKSHAGLMYEDILYIAIAYILLYKHIYGYHNQTYFYLYLANRTLVGCQNCDIIIL